MSFTAAEFPLLPAHAAVKVGVERVNCETGADCVGDVQEFLEAYKSVEFTKSPEKYFKYSVKDIQAMLIDTLTK